MTAILNEPISNDATERLRILSYNIQSGLPSDRLSHYLTNSWRHILPNPKRDRNMSRIATLLQPYDIVALQEIDAGSLRTGFINQVQYLAYAGNFPHWYLQVNRNFGKFGKLSNAVLSRIQPFHVANHKLPGMIPGRGAIQLFYGDRRDPLVVIMMHLALGPIARNLQLQYIENLIEGYKHVILIGDMNCLPKTLHKSNLMQTHQLQCVNNHLNTYPSWRPRRNIDQVLVSQSVKVHNVKVLDLNFSDHLPISLEVSLPS